jgi:hypothetical protein
MIYLAAGKEGQVRALRYPKWQKPCEDALLEPDPQKLFQRVIVAETAIFHRLYNLANSPENIELRAIADMLKNFLSLVANTFILPDREESDTQRPLQIPHNRFRPH